MTVPLDTVSLADYERHFLNRADEGVIGYIAGAAADGLTQAANRKAFDALRLMPKSLVDLRQASAACTLLGESLPFPILIAPTAYHRLVHPAGERATAEAARLTRTPYVVSQQASIGLEEVAEAAGDAILWFQLYLRPLREETLTLVRRAEDSGYRALVVTVDAPVTGIRNHEQRAGFVLPPDISAVNMAGMVATDPVGGAGSPVFRGMLQHAARWEDIRWLRSQTRLPILLKGILNPDDAGRVVDLGVDGIIVSNHGGRTLDTLPATIEALPAVVSAVRGRVPVLLDGGIRRGTDVLKAIASGAAAVLVGQPVLHALAVGGMVGVAHMLTILQTELEVAMALAGRPTLSDLDASVLFRS